jgi:hypothetical protein
MKVKSKEIIKNINNKEAEVLTTVVHLSEVSNILKRSMSIDDLKSLFVTLYSLENVEIVGVTAEDYLAAVEMADELGLDPNDSLAVHFMQKKDIKEILSFDQDFEQIEGIKRLP